MKRRRLPVRFRLVIATFLLSIILYIDRSSISVAKEGITGDLNLTDKQFGWVLSAFALGYALFQVPAGALADRFGPRRILSRVVAAWATFTALTGVAWNLASLAVCRFFFGLGEAGAFPGIARVSYSWIPMKERGIVNGINFSGGRLGAAIALPLVALVIIRDRMAADLLPSGFHRLDLGCCLVSLVPGRPASASFHHCGRDLIYPAKLPTAHARPERPPVHGNPAEL
jgi:ACS family glucarate transporter-like MFS transporter